MTFHRYTQTHIKGSATELCRRTQHILGHVASYYLFELCRSGIRTYSVRVLYNGESAACCLGRNRHRAYDLFCKLVDGKVTPLTLADITSDAFAAG